MENLVEWRHWRSEYDINIIKKQRLLKSGPLQFNNLVQSPGSQITLNYDNPTGSKVKLTERSFVSMVYFFSQLVCLEDSFSGFHLSHSYYYTFWN